MSIPQKMQAAVLEAGKQPLNIKEIPVPQPGEGEVLLKVHACGVCRTDLHIVDGELTEPKLPLVPGHEIVGSIVQTGTGVEGLQQGDRIGVPWLGYTCGRCKYCRRDQENLCENAQFTGYTRDGGFAEYTVAHQHYCFKIPEVYEDAEASPLLCAGLIGYRSYRMAGEHVKNLGVYGFGAAAHIMAQVAVHQGKNIYAFVKPGDEEAKKFACSLGAVWAGDSHEKPPVTLDAAIIFAPVGALVPAALEASDKGAQIVCGGIHMSDIPSFPYKILWEERQLRSVANLERRDGTEFMAIAPKVPVKTEVHTYPLTETNKALEDLREGRFSGAAVLVP